MFGWNQGSVPQEKFMLLQVLLPLFAQLDQPVNPKYTDTDAIDYTIDPKLHVQVLTLLRDMLSGSVTNQEEMLRCHGFSIIAYLLQRVSPTHLTSEAVSALKELSERLVLIELQQEMYLNIFLDFRLWIYTDFSVHQNLLELLNEMYLNRREVMRNAYRSLI